MFSPALGVVGALLLGCGSGHPAVEAGGTQTTTEPAVTYHRDIRPVVEQNCAGCHQAGGIAPFELTSYDAVVPQQGAMVKAVGDGIMPPWRARLDCHPLEGDRRLSEEDIALFAKWKALDFPEGDPKTYKARPALPGVTPLATDADVVIQMAEAYTAPTTGNNTYQCFLLPYTFDKDTYVTAIDVHPQQHSVVHHVQIHTFPPSSLAAAQAAEAADPGPGFPCAGGSVTGATNIYSWRPGATAVEMLPGDAMLVTAGTGVIIQVHYNIQGIALGETPPPDQSSIAFWTLPDGEKPDRVIVRKGLFGGLPPLAPLLTIKAGESHVVVSQDYPASFLATVGNSQLDAEIAIYLVVAVPDGCSACSEPAAQGHSFGSAHTFVLACCATPYSSTRRSPRSTAKRYGKFPLPVSDWPAIPAAGQAKVSTNSWPSTLVRRIEKDPLPKPPASVSVPSLPRWSAM